MKRFCYSFAIVFCMLFFAACSQAKSSDVATEPSSDAQEQLDEDTYGHGDFDTDNYYETLQNCVKQIRSKTDFVPDVALVLGSGLGGFADDMDVEARISYSEINGFPKSTVPGHDGELIFCKINDKKVVIMKGRVHYYEGYDMKEVVLPLRVLHMLGANTVILTNAAGAINADFSVGDFVIAEDHISSFVPSPLIGGNIDELGDRFIDMTQVYDKKLIETAESIARLENIPIQKGVYLQVTGPQYETPTEIKMYRSLGADTIGMSTVVEAIACRHMGMRICTISCITNMAAGMQETLSHEEVQASSVRSAANFTKLIRGLIEEMEV